MVRRLAVLLVLAAACSGRPAAPPPSNEIADDHHASGVDLKVEPVGGGHVAVVRNLGDAPVRLHRELAVSHGTGGAWAAVDASNLYLRARCDVPGDGLYEPPPCVELAAHATLRAAAWTDSIGDSQCACEECAPVPAGTYRFTVTTCDDDAAISSAPFEVARR